MRVKDFLKGKPMMNLDHVVLDISSFVFHSEFTGESLLHRGAVRGLDILNLSYNFISVKPPKQKSFISKVLSSVWIEDKEPTLGKVVEAPYSDWIKLLNEYGTILIYYGNISNPEIAQYIPENRRLRFTADAMMMDTLISQYRTYHEISSINKQKRIELEKLKRSSAKNRILSEARINPFLRKFDEYKKDT